MNLKIMSVHVVPECWKRKWLPPFFIFCVAGLAFAQPATDPYKPVLDRWHSLTTQELPGWRFHEDIPHPEDASLDDSSWDTISVDKLWSSGARVLRQQIQTPEKFNGYSIQGAQLKLDVTFASNAPLVISIFINGSMAFHGNEELQQPILLSERATPGQKFAIAIRLDAQAVPTRIAASRLLIQPARPRPDPALLRDEILAALPMISAYPSSKSEHEAQLDAAVAAIDLSSLDHGDQGKFDESLRLAQKKLELLGPWLKQFTIRAVGNAHIDMAWLWPWTETVQVVHDTFRSVLDLVRDYPDFKFTMSSARAYEWMEEKYPDLFAEIQQRVHEGRWEVIGGMWVEPDLNMPGGESLVRQILVGKRYFQKEFGVDIKIGWNPDSFGYNWQLPQIYKKSGIDYFVTQKLLWAHEFTTFPYKLFWWQAPDGSRILTYFPHDYGGSIEAPSLGKDLSEWTPSIYGQNFSAPEMMHLYGVGDHGGGPTRTMLDNAMRLTAPDVVFPRLQFSTTTAFFADMEKMLPGMKVPTWNDELYFQYHRGVFTTQADTKQRIRQTEETLLDAEKLASFATLFGHAYPQEEMNRAWKRLLFDDFHDIFPGSGIAVNYLDAKRNLEDVQRVGRAIIDESLREIAAHVNTQAEGTPILVFNTLSWSRTEVIEGEVQLPRRAQAISVVDSQGKSVAAQLLALDPATHRARFLLLTHTPSLGYSTHFVRAADRSIASSNIVKARSTEIENEYLRLKIDPHSGCITSLFDKRTSSEALAPAETDTGGPKDFACGNLLQAFYDKPKEWDAWNIDADFERQHWDLLVADNVEMLENGPLRAVVRVKKHFQNSAFVQDITMYAGVPRVDVKMQTDWHEKHILLKVAFPLSAHSPRATYEIPYGNVERPTTRSTPAEKAEFEVPAIHWADISDAQHGFSLLNDSKYGYDAKGNVLRLSLLRSPEWPDPHADEGHHEFTYSLLTHGGTWREAQTVRRGYELNYKPIAVQVDNHEGSLPGEHSFAAVEPDNVIVTAIKNSEDDDSLILRYFEWAGKDADIRLQLSPAGADSEADLIERTTRNLQSNNGTVNVPTQAYEIKTVKIHLSKRQN
jgi:alpha-mannosidase